MGLGFRAVSCFRSRVQDLQVTRALDLSFEVRCCLRVGGVGCSSFFNQTSHRQHMRA